MTTPPRKPTPLWNSLVARGGLARGGLALAGLVACTPSIEDYPRELEQAFCDWQHSCHSFERTRDCVDALVIDQDPQFAYLVRANAAGSVKYDVDTAADCLDAIRDRGCNNDDVPPEVCDRVFVGQVGRNAPCINTAECAGNAVCGFDPTCSDQCCVGACRVFADPVEIGAACSFSGTACVPEAYCAQDPMTGLTTVCTKLVKPGGDCSLGQQCDENSQCDGEGKCRKVKLAGEGEACGIEYVRCAEPHSCIYTSDGKPRCGSQPVHGEPCDPSEGGCQGFNAYCDEPSGLCTLKPGPGQACGYECLPYAICENNDAEPDGDGSGASTSSCVRLPTEGEHCEEYGRCLGDLQCVDTVCALPTVEATPVCEVPAG